jgi:hypothetical protein
MASRRANIFGRVGPFIGESSKLRKLLLIAFDVCFWTALIAAIVTTVARLGAHAKGSVSKQRLLPPQSQHELARGVHVGAP